METEAQSPLRQTTKIYMGLLVVLATGALIVGLALASSPDLIELIAIVTLTFCAIIAILRPLNFTYKAEVYLDTVVLMLALLLLEPGYAMLVAAAGGAIANAFNRRSRAEIFFNAAQLTLLVVSGAVLLSWGGWNADAGTIPWPESIPATLFAGTVMYLVNTALVSGVIALQDRAGPIGVWYDMTIRSNPAEVIAYVAQLGIALLGTIVAHAEPWAIVLLLLPAVAVYMSLQQHVDMRRRAEMNLEAAQRLVGLGSWDWDLRSGEQRWSDELFSILGLTPSGAQANTEQYLSLVHPDDRTFVGAALGGAAASGSNYEIDHRILPANGADERIVHARGEVHRGKNGRPSRVVGTVHDITERKRLEQRLEHLAYHDPLTNLPNRTRFQQKLDLAMLQAGNRIEIAVLFLDLDRFKLINDTFGHEAGDQLLCTVAERLRTCTRPGDVVARLGGDEFTILIFNVSTDAEAIRVAERIIQEITQPMTLPGNREAVISTSIGIVRPGPDHKRGSDLLRDADNAQYRAKEGGRNQFVLFDSSMGEEIRERVALESDLRHALERNQMQLLFQPKIDLATGRPVAVEALARWKHPERGWVPPSSFIPIAEEIGLIGQIGRWVLRSACLEAITWKSLVGEPPVLSVNLSGKQLHDPEIVGEIETLLAESGLPPSRLRLEITETVAMQNADATIQALWKLRQSGVHVVIDDFGTGYSSLSSLQRFPVDTLQLDHSFVANLGLNREASTIATAVIGLAHGLGLKVVAEGVERQDQLTHLLNLGCEQAQGNFFSAPIDATDLRLYLAQRTLPPRSGPALDDDPDSLQQ